MAEANRRLTAALLAEEVVEIGRANQFLLNALD
jgi:hypothetical protein